MYSKNVNIEVKENNLNISAKNKKKEIVSVEKNKLNDHLEAGIPKIKLPKAEKIKPKQISIK